VTAQRPQFRHLGIHMQDATGIFGPARADQVDEAGSILIAAGTQQDQVKAPTKSAIRAQARSRLVSSVA
jgi:hypothetical protein